MRPPATFAVRVAADRATRDRMTPLAIRVRRPVDTLEAPGRASIAAPVPDGKERR